ncbi:transposase [Nannocystis pusilla]|uniref:transposase n=1 Tax=Nannocystis pusilla TaxID=889268 RepID=UPI003DA25519
MDNVLDTLAQPADASEPVVALDERPVVLRDPARPGRPASPGRMARQDYEYVRRGTANIFCIVEPKAGRHLTYATPNRTAKQFARALRRIAQRYRSARTIHLVMDNLNTHRENSLCATFGGDAGRELRSRFTVHARRATSWRELRAAGGSSAEETPMNDEEQEVRAALRERLGDNEKEIRLMLGQYEGRHLTVRGFFRKWLEGRLAEQAGWMLAYINVELIADAAVALGRVVTIEAAAGTARRPALYVFLYKP